MPINELFSGNNEPLVRFGFFFGIFMVMVLWEKIAPLRHFSVSRPIRWFSNLSLVVLNTVTLRVIFPLAAVDIAEIAEARHWGLFNNITLSPWQVVLLSVIGLDGIIYLQHVMFHALPALWRVHRVHHADLDFDFTTGLRFHPLEILISMGIKIAAVVLLGTPAIAVLFFEVLLNATSMFNHGNISLSVKLEHWLRLLVVTPDMHRIHHSVIPRETNSNFGFNLPWWDYLFGTYRARPSVCHKEMTIGLAEFQNNRQVKQLPWMLVLPFLSNPI